MVVTLAWVIPVCRASVEGGGEATSAPLLSEIRHAQKMDVAACVQCVTSSK